MAKPWSVSLTSLKSMTDEAPVPQNLPRERRIGARACSNCHNRKIRCDLWTGVAACSNCQASNQECKPHTRKRRRVRTETFLRSSENLDLHGSLLTTVAYSHDRSVDVVQNSLGEDSYTGTTRSRERCVPTYSSPSGSYLGRAEYIGGIVPIDEEDAKRYHVGHNDAPSETYQKYLRELKAFDLPPRSVRQGLVANFMERCQPWMPIVDGIDIENSDASESSMLLVQAIFVAGSRVSTAPHAKSLGDAFYRRAKALFNSDQEKDPLTVIQAICLLQWWNPSGAEHVSMDASSFWLHMGVALAHQVGLHRDPGQNKLDAGFRRRLWWTLFSRDCMISSSHGRPRAIARKDYDVRPLTLEDFPVGYNEEDARLFMAYVEIASILGDLTEHSFRGSLGHSNRVAIECRLLRWMEDLHPKFHLHNRQTGQLNPYNFKARQLHVPYFTALSILFRPTVLDKPPPLASVLSSSFVAGIIEDFLVRGEVPFLPSVFTFHLLAAALAELASHNYPVLWVKAEQELKLMNQALEELAHRYPSAVGAQRVIKGVTRAIQRQQTQRKPLQLIDSTEQLQFFSFFGPDLCSKWSIIHGYKELERNNYFRDEPVNLPPTRFTDETTERNLTADESAVAGLISLQDPRNSSGPAPVSQPVTPAVSADPSIFFSNNMIDSVGNWMLNDWMTDLSYLDAVTKSEL
ncbi:hypothetical protein VTO42DRAFT_7262 [Malbranchea cinnamomea]